MPVAAIKYLAQTDVDYYNLLTSKELRPGVLCFVLVNPVASIQEAQLEDIHHGKLILIGLSPQLMRVY